MTNPRIRRPWWQIVLLLLPFLIYEIARAYVDFMDKRF